jgi:hypothetical protein
MGSLMSGGHVDGLATFLSMVLVTIGKLSIPI